MQRGIFDAFGDAVMSPLFLGGAALLGGEGIGGAINGFQAGGNFAAQKQKQVEQQRQRQAFDELAKSGTFGGVPREIMSLAQAAGPDAGIDLLAKSYQAQQGYGQQERMARLQHDLEMKRQASDPLRALQIQSLQQKADPNAEFNARRQQASQLGLTEGTPQFQAFVGSGKFLREDQQPLTATDKKAILEADDAVMTADESIRGLRQAQKISPNAYSGPLAETRGYVTGLFGSSDGQATQELSNVVTAQALSNLKAIFGAAPTEGERKMLLEIQGSVNQPPAVRESIYRRAEAMAQRRRDMNAQRSNELRGGTFYKPQGNEPQAQRGANSLKEKYGLE